MVSASKFTWTHKTRRNLHQAYHCFCTTKMLWAPRCCAASPPLAAPLTDCSSCGRSCQALGGAHKEGRKEEGLLHMEPSASTAWCTKLHFSQACDIITSARIPLQQSLLVLTALHVPSTKCWLKVAVINT